MNKGSLFYPNKSHRLYPIVESVGITLANDLLTSDTNCHSRLIESLLIACFLKSFEKSDLLAKPASSFDYAQIYFTYIKTESCALYRLYKV